MPFFHLSDFFVRTTEETSRWVVLQHEARTEKCCHRSKWINHQSQLTQVPSRNASHAMMKFIWESTNSWIKDSFLLKSLSGIKEGQKHTVQCRSCWIISSYYCHKTIINQSIIDQHIIYIQIIYTNRYIERWQTLPLLPPIIVSHH